MTDPRPTDEDELISRVLDGEATAVDRARVAGDARLQARVQDFEQARAAVADVEPPAAGVRDAAIAAALAEAAPFGATDDRGRADMLAYARGRRRRRRVVSAVAVAAALFIGVPLLAIALTGRGTEEKSGSTAAVEAAADAPTETAAPTFGGTSDLTGYAGDLGVLETDAQLQAAVANALSAASTARTDSSGASQLALPPQTAEADSAAPSNSSVLAAPACINYLATAEPGLGFAALTATASWHGEPALIVVYRGVTDTIVVVDDSCTVLARLPT